eukprot:1049529-Pelagomonas_calceolata.AAC.2
MGEVKEHVFGETIRRMYNQGSFSRGSAPPLVNFKSIDAKAKPGHTAHGVVGQPKYRYLGRT